MNSPDGAAPAPPHTLPRREQVIGSAVTWLSTWSLRWILVAAGAWVLGWLVSMTWSVLLPLLLAMVLTTVLQFPATLLERRLGFSPLLSALTSVLTAIGVVVLVVLFIAPSIAPQLGELATSASDGLTQVRDYVQGSRLGISQGQVDSLLTAIQDRLRASASTIASGVLIGVGAVTHILVNALLVLVLSFFFLKDGRRFLPWMRQRTGQRVGGHLAEVATRVWATLGGFVRTQALVGLIDAVLIGLGLVVVGVPLALPLAVLTFVAAFAPVVGAVTVGALAVLVALVANGWVSALIVVGIVLVVQQLEGNVFLPWLQGRSLGLHAAVVLLTIVLGSTLFGVVGAFLGVPVVAAGAVVLRYLDELVTDRSAAVEDRVDHASNDKPESATASDVADVDADARRVEERDATP